MLSLPRTHDQKRRQTADKRQERSMRKFTFQKRDLHAVSTDDACPEKTPDLGEKTEQKDG